MCLFHYWYSSLFITKCEDIDQRQGLPLTAGTKSCTICNKFTSRSCKNCKNASYASLIALCRYHYSCCSAELQICTMIANPFMDL